MKMVRNGQKVWPYCSECGCRLAISKTINDEALLCHWGSYDTDMRGCVCSLVNKTYYVSLKQVLEYEPADLDLRFY